MEFATRYNRKPYPGEDISPKSKTEQTGYIPPQIQIERMIQSGVQLNNFRKENYDFSGNDAIDDTVSVPTRSPGFDMADASALALEVAARLDAQEKAIAEEKAAAEAAALAAQAAVNSD